MKRQETTVLDILEKRAMTRPDKTAYIFLEDGEKEKNRISYRNLYTRSGEIAAVLRRLTRQQQTRAIILCPGNIEYITAFLGCLYAGIIAVTAYTPSARRHDLRIQSIVDDCTPGIVLATSQLCAEKDAFLTLYPALKNATWVAVDDIPCITPEAPVNISPADIAFLQYTSGSTSQPRGIMVTHGNIMHNESLIYTAFQHSADAVIFGWLPLFHDMGLIGNILQPLYAGAVCIFMPPAAFLKRPLHWLKGIAAYRATTSGGPNFSYELCLDHIDDNELTALDLSSWNLAFNGSEPVRHSTLERFYDKFKVCGFRKEALYPCYGLAESTLFVSGGQKEKVFSLCKRAAENGPETVQSSLSGNSITNLVSSGQAGSDTEIMIVNRECLPCREGETGEIWVHGPSVAGGYWEKDEATATAFRAKPAFRQDREKEYLRTGDLGFIHNNELYVTGRIRELIIINGVNYYPQDVELLVEEAHPALKANGCIAFAVEGDQRENLVVVQELKRSAKQWNYSEIHGNIRQKLAETILLEPHCILLVKGSTLPRTSSGKKQRLLCRQRFLDKEIAVLDTWEQPLPVAGAAFNGAVNDPAAWLLERMAALTGMSGGELDRDKPPAFYGLDSLKLMNLIRQAEEEFGIEISPDMFFLNGNIGTLLSEFANHITSYNGCERIVRETAIITESVLDVLDECGEPELDSILADLIREQQPEREI